MFHVQVARMPLKTRDAINCEVTKAYSRGVEMLHDRDVARYVDVVGPRILMAERYQDGSPDIFMQDRAEYMHKRSRRNNRIAPMSPAHQIEISASTLMSVST